MLSESLKIAISERLSLRENCLVQIRSFSPIGGGCINNAMKIGTNRGDFFLKTNLLEKYPKMFETEYLGLKLLHATGEIRIPQPLEVGQNGEEQFLLTEYIKQGLRGKNFWKDFGIAMANLHKHSLPEFGLDFDNYIGSLPQSNKQHKSFSDFFIEERITPLLRLLEKSGMRMNDITDKFNRFFLNLPNLVPEEKPSLLHGDLWSGNFFADENGNACIFDPSVYYGNREVDIAMSLLFGGFSAEFYDSYNDAFPLQPGWEERIEIHQVYPLLVHANLFGGAYLRQVIEIIDRYQ